MQIKALEGLQTSREKLLMTEEESHRALQASYRFLEIANRHTEMIPLLKEFVAEVKNFTGCAAAGIRISDDEGNIPYQAYEGFSQGLYESESPLSIKSDRCMCINVVKGMTDPNLPFYTEGGSFYVNGTTRFLATVSEEERGQTRNVCNLYGYESVALLPILLGDRTLGLIHVADPQENMVPLEMVEVLEGVAMQLGTALQRVRAEEALRRSEAHYRAFVEQIPAVTYIAAPDEISTTLYFSPQIEEALGFSQAEWLADPELFRKRLHPDDRERVMAELTRSRAGGEPFASEYRLLARDGSVFWFRDEAAVVRDDAGNPILLQGVMLDITERKRAEEKLEKYHDHLEMLVEERTAELTRVNEQLRQEITERRALEGIWRKYEFIANTSKEFMTLIDKNYVYEAVNEPYCRAQNRTREEIIGRTVADIWGEERFSTQIKEHLDQCFAGNEVHYQAWFEFAVLGLRCFDVACYPYYSEGTVRHVVVVSRDVTERKRTEEALQYRVELQRLITTLSTHFINLSPGEVDGEITRALQTIGEFAGVDRSYVCLFSGDGMKMTSTHEWCAAGIRPQIDNLKDVPVAILPQTMEKLNRFEALYVPRVADFAPDGDAEKELLLAQDIQSFILVPMAYGGSLIGFLGLDSVRTEKSWPEETIVLLRIVGEIFANALVRRQVEEEIRRLNAELEQRVVERTAELRESEEKLAGIVYSITDHMSMMDKDYNILWTNEVARHLFGPDLVGRKCYEAYHWREKPCEPCVVKRVFEDGQVHERETKAIRADGRTMDFWCKASVAGRCPDGRPKMVVEVSRNITERKRQEEALLRSEERYHTLFEESRDAIYITSRGGKFVDVNQSALDLFGYTREEMVGLDDQEIYVHPGGRHRFQQEIEQKGFVRDYEVKLRKKDGAEMDCLLTSTVRRANDGSILGYQGIIRDITERKWAEEERKRRIKQLTALNRASQAVTASLKLDQVLAEVVSLAGEVTDSDYARVVLVDEEGKLFRGVAIEPDVPDLKSHARLEGCTNWIIRSRQAVVVDDIAEDGIVISQPPEGAPGTINPHTVETDLKSFAGLPLIVKDRLLGVLYVESLRPYHFHHQLPLLTTFANQAAIAIENARLYHQADEKLQTSFRELKALYAIAEMMNYSPDLDAVLRLALYSALEVVRMDSGGVMLLDPSTGELFLRAHGGLSPAFIRAVSRTRAEEGLMPRMLNSVLTINDPAEVAEERRMAIEKEGLQSMVGIPLKAGESPLGVMILASHRPRTFAAKELELLAAIGNQVGVAVDRAHLQAQELRAAILEERQDMARQMHDDIAQTLGYLGLQVDNVMDSSSLAQNAVVQVELEGIRKAIEDAYERVRNSIARLEEDVPDRFDLGAALPEIISEFEKQTECRVELRVDRDLLSRLPPSVALQATYIIREALANVRKHSGADSVHLTLQCLENGMAEITIQDNGQGFDLDSEQQVGWEGFGLRFMRGRAERAGGSLIVESQPGRGTRVVASLPSS
jgi:PAS domain S-box-containing protein